MKNLRTSITLMLTLILSQLLFTACPPPPPPPPTCEEPSIPRADDYNADNFFYKVLPESVTIKPGSQLQIDRLVTETSNLFRATIDNFCAPVYYANNQTPRYNIYRHNDFCYNGVKDVLLEVPIPAGALPAPGTDEQINIIDTDNNILYDIISFKTLECNLGACFTYGGATVVPLKNSGIMANKTHGAGILSLSGTIWPHELNDGEINHALRGGYSVTSTEFTEPAIKSDGTSTDGDAIPMGTLLQLNPDLDVNDPIWGMTEDEKTVARAMQRYGIYISDTNGAGLALNAVGVQSFDCNPYRNTNQGSTLTGGCNNKQVVSLRFSNIPLDQLRVIEYPHDTPSLTEDIGTRTSTICLGCGAI